jgi:Domain of unknown function (DUF4350)
MSDGLTYGDRKLLAVAGGVSFVVIALGIVLSRHVADATENPTTYSVGSGGAKAAYLLLAQSGYHVQRWEESLTDLPTGDGGTLILAEPEGSPTPEERAALTEFIEEGGRLIATGTTAGFFLSDYSKPLGHMYAIPDPIAGLTWERIPSTSPSSITRAAAEITLAPEAYWYPESSVMKLYGGLEKPRVVKYARGKGEVIWWASATPLTNAGLREPGNLEFFLACLGDAQRPVLFDEYFHGHRRAEVAARARSRFTWIAGQAVLILTATLLTYSRRSGPIVAAKPESRLSPLEFVRTLGSVYDRAGAASIAVDIGYERFRYQLTQRLGMGSNSPVEQIDRAATARWNLEGQALGELLRSCERARHDPNLSTEAAIALSRSLTDWTARLGLSPRQMKEKA